MTIQDQTIYAELRKQRFDAWYEWKKTSLPAWKELYEHYTKQLAEVGEV